MYNQLCSVTLAGRKLIKRSKFQAKGSMNHHNGDCLHYYPRMVCNMVVFRSNLLCYHKEKDLDCNWFHCKKQQQHYYCKKYC